jgi:hypothetical protein
MQVEGLWWLWVDWILTTLYMSWYINFRGGSRLYIIRCFLSQFWCARGYDVVEAIDWSERADAIYIHCLTLELSNRQESWTEVVPKALQTLEYCESLGLDVWKDLVRIAPLLKLNGWLDPVSYCSSEICLHMKSWHHGFVSLITSKVTQALREDFILPALTSFPRAPLS